MIVGSGTLDLDYLAPSIRRALLDACTVVVDEAFNSVEALAEGDDFADTPMDAWLPPKHLPRYDIGFARRFAVCVISVAGKLADRHPHVLASVAEEMALAAIMDEADVRPEAEGAFQDADFDVLFDARLDGLEDVERVAYLAMANRRFD